MQIVAHTGWSLEYIYSFDIDEFENLLVWAHNRDKQLLYLNYLPHSWYAGIQNRKTADNSNKQIKKALKALKYNYIDKEDLTEKWNDFFVSMNAEAFDKFIKGLHKK